MFNLSIYPFLKIHLDEFLNQVDIVEVIRVNDWVWNSVLLNNHNLHGCAEKKVKIESTYVNFNFKETAYCFHVSLYELEREMNLDSGIHMGYVYRNGKNDKMKEAYLTKEQCPLTGKKYNPLPFNIKKIKIMPHYFANTKEVDIPQPYAVHSCSAFYTPIKNYYTDNCDIIFENLLQKKGYESIYYI